MKALIAFVLYVTCSYVYADNVGYEVEVIIFEDVTGIYHYSERWGLMSEEQPEADTQVSSQTAKKNKVERHFSNINNSKSLRLAEQVEKLAKHPDFNVLVHKAWKQAGLDRNDAFSVFVDSNDYKPSNKLNPNADGNYLTYQWRP